GRPGAPPLTPCRSPVVHLAIVRRSGLAGHPLPRRSDRQELVRPVGPHSPSGRTVDARESSPKGDLSTYGDAHVPSPLRRRTLLRRPGDDMTSETPHSAPRTPSAPLVLGTWTAPSGSPGGETPHTVTPLWDQALPASVWRGVLGDVEVRLETEGGPAALWAARDGHRRRLATDLSAEHRVRLGPDGPQWLWVEGPVSTVTWSIETSVQLPPITVVVPTRLREDDALTQAERFARMDCVHEVIVVDQGGTLDSSPDFARLLAQRPSIRLITQPNLGGSGGYARGMLEAAATPHHAVLLSDDDAVLSEESLRR